MNDKDAPGMLRELVPVTARVICTTAHTPRAEPAAVLARIARAIPGTSRIDAIEDPTVAVEQACAVSLRVVVAGSIFLIVPLRGILR